MSDLVRHETPFGAMFHNAGDQVIGKSLQLYGQWAMDEIALLTNLMQRQEGDFIDLGANVGCHTVAMATLFPDRDVFAFEANPASFQILAANVAVNSLSNAKLFNLLVGETSAMRKVAINWLDAAMNYGAVAFQVVSPSQEDGVLMLQVAVDDVYPRSRSVAVVKADLEGMEAQALVGLRNTLARCRAVFYFENGAQKNTGLIFDELAKLGYQTFWHINQVFSSDNFLANASNIYGNRAEIATLCVPSEHPSIQEIREHLIPTSRPMGDAGWHKCVALNAELRLRVRERLAPRRSIGALRDYLLNAYARSRTGVEPNSTTEGVMPELLKFSDVRRFVALDIPGERLRSLLRPLIERAPLDEQAYLRRHSDVAAAVARGQFASARHHYVVAGYFEGRSA